MIKIKIFRHIRSNDLEKNINNWLKDNQNIEILFTNYVNDNDGWYNLSLIYKEKDVGSDADEVD